MEALMVVVVVASVEVSGAAGRFQGVGCRSLAEVVGRAAAAGWAAETDGAGALCHHGVPAGCNHRQMTIRSLVDTGVSSMVMKT